MSTDVDLIPGFQPLTDRQEEEVHSPTDPWSDSFALKVAVQDFLSAEAYRTANHDWRWRTSNELYQAWVQQKYWEGSRIPRASIGVFVAFEQIESMLPKILSAIFAENPWFQSDPLFGTTAEQARQWGNHILEQMDETSVREVFRRCIKSGLLFGNGIMKLSWCLQQKERMEWLPKMQQKPSQNGRLPQFERVLDKQTISYIENRPILEYVSLADFYIDPNASSPIVDDSRFVAERKLVSVDDLTALRNQTPWKIPGDDRLLSWARYKSSAQGDNTKASSELFRLGSWQPVNDGTVDPGGKRIEVIEYRTKERIVLVANREWCLFNAPNSYGFMGYYDAFYADVLDRFYAMGVADVVEGEQRLQQALLNGRLDELSLALHRPMIKKLGIKTPTYSLRARPGQIWEAEDPKNDYQFLDVPNITAQAFVETQASELRVQKSTGMSDLFAQGVPASGGNSANRTATGIGQQAQAGSERIRYLVENIEDAFIEPMLKDVVKLNKMFPPIGTSMADVVALSRVNLSMRASAKMQSRMSLLQTFPLVFQTLANPALIQELAASGSTVDWKELMSILMDMTGYQKRADVIRPLSPQEQQQRNQPPSDVLIKAKMQEQRSQAQMQLAQQKQLADSQSSEKDLAAQAQIEKMKLGIERQNKLDEIASNEKIEREKMLLEAQIEREKLKADEQESEVKILMELASKFMEMRQAEKDEAEGPEIVETDADGLISRLIKKVGGKDRIREIERDAEGRAVRIKTHNPVSTTVN